MADYRSRSNTSFFHFLGDVAKEVVSQATGIKFDFNKKENEHPWIEAEKACAEAISSTFRQQEEYEWERDEEENIDEYDDYKDSDEQFLSDDDQWDLDFD